MRTATRVGVRRTRRLPVVPAEGTFTDNFNRSNRSLIGDNGWSRIASDTSSAWEILDNQARASALFSPNGDGYTLLTRPALSTTRHVVRANLISSGDAPGLLWGYEADNDYHYARMTSNTVAVRYYNGVRQDLATFNVGAAPQVIEVQHTFATGLIVVIANGVEVGRYTTSVKTRSAASRVGLVAYLVGNTFDDFYHSG